MYVQSLQTAGAWEMEAIPNTHQPATDGFRVLGCTSLLLEGFDQSYADNHGLDVQRPSKSSAVLQLMLCLQEERRQLAQ